jgi:chloramphenicol-sensitive protein RarD
MSYTLASTLLPFNMLGLLGYVEPCMMMLVSFLIGERLEPSAYTLMMCLIIAISCLILDGIAVMRKKQKTVKTQCA